MSPHVKDSEQEVSVATRAMSLRLSEEMAAELDAVARADGVAVSEAIREAIDRQIAAKRLDKDFQKRLKRMMEEDREVLKRLAEGGD
jgi:metal-responsive CopG/Arc/MetJ family transcriptional regulator